MSQVRVSTHRGNHPPDDGAGLRTTCATYLMVMPRFALRLLLMMLVLFGLVVASPGAMAKEGIRARLVTPIPRDAPEGAKLNITWTLRTVDGGPLGASGFFVRLIGRPGSTPHEAEAIDAGGRYLASVVVPPGGIERVQIGLRGWRQMAKDGPQEPAPVFFPIEGQVFREPANAPMRWPLLLLTIPVAGIVWWWRRTHSGRDDLRAA